MRTKAARSYEKWHHAGANGDKRGPALRVKLGHELRFDDAGAASLMDAVDEILARAKQRAEAMRLPYAGALLPSEAHALLQQVPGTRLVDVRTQAEWEYVGQVPGSVLIEWNTFPSGQRNSRFVEQLQASVPKTEAPVMFICRSGVRSHHAAAAATQSGYPNSYNILEGFEGDKDAQGHRNSIGGWRFAGLPWIQR